VVYSFLGAFEIKSFSREDKEEEIEKNNRKNNIIVHGVKESNKSDPEERMADDCDTLQTVFHHMKCDTVNIQQVVRLGKRPNGDNEQPRPIKLVTDSEESKIKILKSTKNLRNLKEGVLSGIFMHQDLTPRERQTRKLLVAEMKDRQSKGEQNLMIVNMKIVTRRTPVHQQANQAFDQTSAGCSN